MERDTACSDSIEEAPAPVKSRTARYLDSLGFVNIAEADSSIAIDLMYTRADNFTGTILYEDLKEAYLHPDAMKSLKQAQRLLKEQYPGYSLIVYDAARPLSVQQKMWDVVKGTSKYIYVSNPSRGGGLHNYGLAVDISILDDKGTPLPMGPGRPSGQGSPHHRRSRTRGTRQADGTRTRQPPAAAAGDERIRIPPATQRMVALQPHRQADGKGAIPGHPLTLTPSLSGNLNLLSL